MSWLRCAAKPDSLQLWGCLLSRPVNQSRQCLALAVLPKVAAVVEGEIVDCVTLLASALGCCCMSQKQTEAITHLAVSVVVAAVFAWCHCYDAPLEVTAMVVMRPALSAETVVASAAGLESAAVVNAAAAAAVVAAIVAAIVAAAAPLGVAEHKYHLPSIAAQRL